MNMQIDYSLGKFLGNEKVICCGRSCGKTSYIEHELVTDVITKPEKKTGYVVLSTKHVTELQNNIENIFKNPDYPILSMFYKTFDKDNRTFKFFNEHLIEVRILGQDKSGGRQFISLHCPKIIVDEAQLIPTISLKELAPTQKAGGQLVYAGVPNDDRTSALWYAVNKPDITYYNYSSEESIDWDEKKEKATLELHGSKTAPSYINLVLGKWGDPTTTAFRVTQILNSFIPIPEFTCTFICTDNLAKAEKSLNLPSRNFSEYISFGIGIDVGYTMEHPTAITVFGNKLEKDEKIHDHCIYRAKLYGNSVNIERIINIVLAYFKPIIVGYDAQNKGESLNHIVDQQYYPETAIFNKSVLRGFISNNPVVVGEFTTHRGVEQIKTNWKNLATNEINKKLNEGTIHFSDQDRGRMKEQGQFPMEGILSCLQAEIQRPRKNRIDGFVYENKVDEDTVDSIRFYYMAKYDMAKANLVQEVKKQALRFPIFNKKRPNFG
jgi:hypothetical protein